jgi:hypothetical protein
MVGADRVLMGRCGVAKNPHDLVLRQQPRSFMASSSASQIERAAWPACSLAVDIRVSFLGIVNRER